VDLILKTLVIINALAALFGTIFAFISRPGVSLTPVGTVGLIAVMATPAILRLGIGEDENRSRELIALVLLSIVLVFMVFSMLAGQLMLPVRLTWGVVAVVGVMMIWSVIAWFITRRPASARLAAGWTCAAVGTAVMAPEVPRDFKLVQMALGVVILAIGVLLLFSRPFSKTLEDLGITLPSSRGDECW